MSNGNGNNWGGANRAKPASALSSFPSPLEGTDGDIQVKQTDLGAKIFGKVSGTWYGAPLTATVGNPVTRIGTGLSDHLSIDSDSVDIFKNNVKVATFGDTTTIGEVGASKSNVQITSGAINLRTNTTNKLTLATSGIITMGNFSATSAGVVTVSEILLTGKINITSTGSQNVCIGKWADSNPDVSGVVDNVAIGVEAGADMESGATDNVCIGTDAGTAITTSNNNVAVGTNCLPAFTSGTGSNTCVGQGAGRDLAAGNFNVYIGSAAGAECNGGDYNVAIGQNAMGGMYGNSNATQCVVVGTEAGNDNVTPNNVVGDNCVLVGYRANTGGNHDNSIVIGHTADGQGANTAVIGNEDVTDFYAAHDGGAHVHCGAITASSHIYMADEKYIGVNGAERIKFDTGGNIVVQGSKFAVGAATNYGMAVNYDTDNYTFGIENGDAQANGIYMNLSAEADGDEYFFRFDNYEGSSGTMQAYMLSNGNYLFGSNLSDRNIKKDIESCDYGLEEVLNLSPSKFKFINRGGDQIYHGFKAQEVAETLPEFVHGNEYNAETEKGGLGIDYNGMIAVLTKAVQELSAKVTALEAKI